MNNFEELNEIELKNTIGGTDSVSEHRRAAQEAADNRQIEDDARRRDEEETLLGGLGV